MAAETTPVALVFRSDDWIPEMVRFVVEAVPKYPVPETESAVEEAYANCEVEEAKRPVRNQAGVVVEFVLVPKVVSTFQSQGRVRVTEPPSVTSPPPVSPLPAEIVTLFAERRFVSMVVVATTFPVESVPSKELVSEVRYVLPVLVKSVVEAWVKKVEEAMREKGEVLFNQSAVEVAFTTTLLYESVVNGKAEAICEGVA